MILEIGAGKGDLTRELLQSGAWVVAIERDRKLADELLRAGHGADRLIVYEGDALKLDWPTLIRHPRFSGLQWKTAGNIPYYITSPLIDKALAAPLPQRVVFLVQAEVADRLAAQPGSKQFGALSVGVQAVATVERLFTVAPGSFRPPPKVASALVRLTPLAEPRVSPETVPAFRRFVTACFTQRRKQLRNSVAHAARVSVTRAAQGLADLGLDPSQRPEQLGVGDFVRLLRWTDRL